MVEMRRLMGLIIATFAISLAGQAQSDADLAALEARLLARLERRIAEESAATNSQISTLRVAVQEAVRSLSKSGNELDHKALVAIDKGAVKEGVAILEERAKARDATANVLALPESNVNQVEKQKRADEWRRIGALAFLDNTDRAIAAYQQALTFAPDDAGILNQLGELYMRQNRWNEKISVGERLTGLKDPEAQANGFFNIAYSYLEQAQPSKAQPNVERCIAIARSARVSRLESRCLSLSAAVSIPEENFRDAERLANQALTIARSGGYDFEEGMALYALAAIGYQRAATIPPAERRAALQEVDRRYADLERLLPKLNNPAAAADIMVSRGRVELALGDFANAESRLRNALASMESSRTTGRISYVEQELGRALVAQNRINEAIPYFSSSVRKAREAKEPSYEAAALMAWAAAEAARSNRAEACRLAQESYRVYVQGVPELRVQHQRAEQQVKQFCR
jgi:tetratricopeptide (TPR) repeat protein